MSMRMGMGLRRLAGVLLCFALLLSACSGGGGATWQEQYELGLRCLEEGNYSEALIAFQAAINIDPKKAEAWLGMADAYLGMGDPEKAPQTLRDALSVVSDTAAIQDRLVELEAETSPDGSPSSASSSSASSSSSSSSSDASPDADYYRFIKDTLLPEDGSADLSEKSIHITSDDLFGSNGMDTYAHWDGRDGILGADPADLNADGTEDLLVYCFDREESPGTLLARVYTRDDSGEIVLTDSAELTNTPGWEDYHFTARLIPSEDGTVLFTEERYMRLFADGTVYTYGIYELKKDGTWFQKYRITQSGGSTINITYSLWTYAEDGTSEETLLWADGEYWREAQASGEVPDVLTPDGTGMEEALAIGLEKTGISWEDAPVSVEYTIAGTYVDYATIECLFVSTLTDSTLLRERLSALE